MLHRASIVHSQLGLYGKDINFCKEDFFGLKPDTIITQIGSGKDNGTIRTDKFKPPAKYVGSVMMQFREAEKMYAFEVAENTYFIYGKTEEEIFTEAIYAFKDRETGKRSSFMKFYKPKFKIK